jgi:intracellular septation protein A
VATTAAPPSARGVVREAVPRLLRDALGPLAAFYLGWKLVGLAVGVLAALAVGVIGVLAARREGRPGAFVRLALVLVLARAAVGLIGDSTTLYLAQDAAIDVALGAAFLGSIALGRPLSGAFAADVYQFPEGVEQSETSHFVFTRITLVWGVAFLIRAGLRLAVLLTGSVDRYVAFAAFVDVAFLVGLLGWSVSYSMRHFRRTPEWAELFGSADVPAGRADGDPGLGERADALGDHGLAEQADQLPATQKR